jgi:sugar/nucleoside kinase (ribokinase family)
VIGSVAYDSIETPFGKTKKTLGGSGTYFSLASQHFAHTSVIAVVGEDFKDLNTLKKKGIDISGIEQAKGKTFHWAGKYHFDLNTRDTLKTELGVFGNFKPKLSLVQAKSKFVFLGNIHPSLQLEVLRQAQNPFLVGADSMNLWIDTEKKVLTEVLTKVHTFIINDSEARQFSKEHNLLKAAKKILKLMGGGINKLAPFLIIKQGEHGLLLFQKNNIFNLPGFPLEDVNDPTGAGDSFAGGFFGFLAKAGKTDWETLKKACVYGSVIASFNVEKFGPQRLLEISMSDIEARKKLFHQACNF